MRTITRLNSKIHYDDTTRPTRKYNVLKEYSRYYLCECVQNGVGLYKECFLKVDVDGVRKIKKKIEPRMGWHM